MDVSDLFSSKTSGTSWKHRLTPEATEFLEALEAHTVETGQPPVYVRVTEAFQDRFGIEVSASTVGDHFAKFMKENGVDFQRY